MLCNTSFVKVYSKTLPSTTLHSTAHLFSNFPLFNAFFLQLFTLQLSSLQLLPSTTLQSTTLHSTTLYSTTLHSETLYFRPLHSKPLYSTTLFYSPLYPTTFYSLHSTALPQIPLLPFELIHCMTVHTLCSCVTQLRNRKSSISVSFCRALIEILYTHCVRMCVCVRGSCSVSHRYAAHTQTQHV